MDSMCFWQGWRKIFVGERCPNPVFLGTRSDGPNQACGVPYPTDVGCTIHSPATSGTSKAGLIMLPERTCDLARELRGFLEADRWDDPR